MIKKIIKQQIIGRLVNKERAREEEIIMSSVSKENRIPLTESEKEIVNEMWNKLTIGGVKDYHIKNWKFTNSLMVSILDI